MAEHRRGQPLDVLRNNVVPALQSRVGLRRLIQRQRTTGGHPAHETALHAGGLHDVHQVVLHIVGDLHLTVSRADIGRFLRRDHRVQLAEHRLRRRTGQHFHLLLPVHVPQ